MVELGYGSSTNFSAFLLAQVITRSSSNTFEDDWETRSPAAATGMRLLAIELENHRSGRPLGLSIARGIAMTSKKYGDR